MAFFKRKLNKNAKNQPDWVRDFYHSSDTITSINGTAFACIDRIASEFASLNYAIFSVADRQKRRNHPLLPVLREPNTEDRHYNFFYQSAVDYYNGGCYWLKLFYDGEVVSLIRLNPSEIKESRDENNRKIFTYRGKIYAADSIVHIPSRFGYNSLYGGKSIFDAVSTVFKTAQNVDAFTQNSFNNGIVGKRMVLDIAQAFPDATPEQIEALKAKWKADYSGVENAGKPIIKVKGIEYSQLEGTVTDNRAAELIENRKFQEGEIAKIFGIPEELLSGLSANTNLENLFVLFNEFALRPMATQFQDAINSLLDESKYYFEFDYNGLMKVSLQQRIASYKDQINNGMASLNEIRQKENLPPLPDSAGDSFFMPVNMMPWNEEIKEAYMAKQKNEVKQINDPTDENTQHIPQGDDKQ